ncbi:hypothetical protein [Streptomyces sp. 3214.6]|uniref:hypothetical protein n=1 Tax=Streptomyces sp. 3214.6 TaxID=1882757 RepID=UPI00090A4DAD|nr:hypothetical protein [Streptomyces sp. 3214.6]SHH85138.1 hypothetical protein SAMN05444521_2229 [Streptomyces sp. 3214.6]
MQRLVIQRWTDGTMQGDDPRVTEDSGRAHIVEVDNLRGRTLGEGHNQPTVEPIGWANLRNAGLVKGGGMPAHAPYRAVRMHLWNGRLGGLGNRKWNLAPGPAKVNSLMSAQAEDPVKDLINSNHRVRLRTEVNYLVSPANDTDFSSVVPNRISMVWKVKGRPGLDGAWQSRIPVPVDPLQGAAKLPYQQWTGSAPALVTDLSTKDDQTRAQVFSLVPTTDLKVAILRAYPDLYRDLSSATQANLLGWLYDANSQIADVGSFLTSVAIASHELVEHAIEPLADAGRTQLVDALFTLRVPKVEDQRQLVFRHPDLVNMVGGPLRDLAKTDDTIFKYYSPKARSSLLSEMPTDQLTEFFEELSKPLRLQILDNWAKERITSKGLPGKAANKLAFIKTQKNVNAVLLQDYEKWSKSWQNQEDVSERRPLRVRKK